MKRRFINMKDRKKVENEETQTKKKERLREREIDSVLGWCTWLCWTIGNNGLFQGLESDILVT